MLASTLRDQINLLAHPQTVTNEVFNQFYDHGIVLTELEQKKAPPSWDSYVTAEEGESMSDMIKRTIPVRQLVLQYVELSKSGRGLCPFHDDQVESFSVNDDENYWNCFAGCGGGSVIDFWMKLRGCDFATAVNDLSRMQSESNEWNDLTFPGDDF